MKKALFLGVVVAGAGVFAAGCETGEYGVRYHRGYTYGPYAYNYPYSSGAVIVTPGERHYRYSPHHRYGDRRDYAWRYDRDRPRYRDRDWRDRGKDYDYDPPRYRHRDGWDRRPLAQR